MIRFNFNLIRQLPSVKKGSLSNSSSDYGLDESYNSSEEVTDSAFATPEYVAQKPPSKTPTRPTNLDTSPQYIQPHFPSQHSSQHNSQHMVQQSSSSSSLQQHKLAQNSQYVVQYSQVQKPSQYQQKCKLPKMEFLI